MPFDLLERKRTHFVLWRPGRTNPPPALVIGTFLAGNPPSFQPLNRFDLAASPVSAARWGWIEPGGTVRVAGGTCRDVRAVVERAAAPSNFAGVAALAPGEAHLEDLGVNALELLPPADSFVDREWGYATSNYFAADFDLGFPKGHASPTASADLAALVAACHRHRLRFFADVVVAFATRYAYRYINFLDFHVHRGTGDPEEDARDDFGGDLFKYNFLTDA